MRRDTIASYDVHAYVGLHLGLPCALGYNSRPTVDYLTSLDQHSVGDIRHLRKLRRRDLILEDFIYYIMGRS